MIAARQQSRAAAQALALQFIDGEPPYQGDFVGHMADLSGPLSQFPQVLAQLPVPQSDAQGWYTLASEHLTQLLARDALAWDYFDSTDYAQVLDRVWQSYFALVITLGYDTALLDEFTRTLRLAHVIEVALLPWVNATATTDTHPELLSVAQLQTLLQASPALPAQVFPLPPAASAHLSPPSANAGWIEPYAIGDLHMVRQRLLRYQSGEIAHIENVMRGERREVTHKRTHRQLDQHKQTSAEMQVLQNDAADERSNLQEEARKTVAETTETNQYNKFTSSYGPPTQATLDGSWSKTLQAGANPGLDDTTRFARDILNKTVNRISRSVSQTRSSSTMSQTEDSVLSLIDNTAGTHSLRAVYRWLNKVYEACVVNYGQRLMMEFMVDQPAASFIAQEHALAGQRWVKPVPPLQLGLASFEDVSPSNYARLGALYGVLDLEPPPLARRIASATLRSGEEKLIAIAAGYCATQAFVNYVSTPAGLPTPVVLVGRQAFSAANPAGTATLSGEDNCVPVSVLDYLPSFSPPSDAQVLVNVEITCIPSARCLDQWRIRIYASIVRAYEERLAAYNARTRRDADRRSSECQCLVAAI
ncbi:MAG: hypothetical protein FD135_2492 [Comamonadaceae bacterium]|nr:MAG: hypothetical protein FD135_2492 [Comamonadaceae bacterium]